jgi:hypothetical protein
LSAGALRLRAAVGRFIVLGVVKRRIAFLISLVLVLLALALRLGALGQFQEGYRLMRESELLTFPAEQSGRGALLLYLSLPLAVASAAFVFVSRRRREPAWRWVTVGLLGLYLLVSFAPA